MSSIQDVQILQRYVLIVYNGARALTNSLYVINPETGYIVYLDNPEMGVDFIERMKVDKETVELNGRDGEKYLLSLDRINKLFKQNSENGLK